MSKSSKGMNAAVSRRAVLAGLAAGLVVTGSPPARATARLGEDGLYHMDWYVESFLDLAEDLAAATARGKRFAVLWGLRGCPGCRRMHEVYLRDPVVLAYVRDNFDILHLDILGARDVTDFDGVALGEKAFAARYGIAGTPSIQFFPESAEGLAVKAPAAREVFRMSGLPATLAEFHSLFRSVGAGGDKVAPTDGRSG